MPVAPLYPNGEVGVVAAAAGGGPEWQEQTSARTRENHASIKHATPTQHQPVLDREDDRTWRGRVSWCWVRRPVQIRGHCGLRRWSSGHWRRWHASGRPCRQRRCWRVRRCVRRGRVVHVRRVRGRRRSLSRGVALRRRPCRRRGHLRSRRVHGRACGRVLRRPRRPAAGLCAVELRVAHLFAAVASVPLSAQAPHSSKQRKDFCAKSLSRTRAMLARARSCEIRAGSRRKIARLCAFVLLIAFTLSRRRASADQTRHEQAVNRSLLLIKGTPG